MDSTVQVKILNRKYTVKYVDHIDEVDSSGTSLGLTYNDINEIIILKNKEMSSPEHQREVLWHELLHALLYAYNLRPTDQEDEEELVKMLARGLDQLIQDNKSVLKKELGL